MKQIKKTPKALKPLKVNAEKAIEIDGTTYVTPRYAATLIGVHEVTISKWAHAGQTSYFYPLRIAFKNTARLISLRDVTVMQKVQQKYPLPRMSFQEPMTEKVCAYAEKINRAMKPAP